MICKVGRWPPLIRTRTSSKPMSRSVGSISSVTCRIRSTPTKKWARSPPSPLGSGNLPSLICALWRRSSRLFGASGSAPEAQIDARATGRKSLAFVARHRPVRRPLPPVRRPLCLPLQLRLAAQREQHGARVAHVVGREAHLAARLQQAGEPRRARGIYDPPLVVLGLWAGG